VTTISDFTFRVDAANDILCKLFGQTQTKSIKPDRNLYNQIASQFRRLGNR